MRYLVCLVVFLPCLLAAEVKTIHCPNGVECPFGKTCCQLPNGVPGCCDVPEEELKNEDLCPALPSASTVNQSLALSESDEYEDCTGTMCFSISCCPYKDAWCCDMNSCCPDGSKCCHKINSDAWCCSQNKTCSSYAGYCLEPGGAASSVKVALLPLLFAFALGVVSKYLFQF